MRRARAVQDRDDPRRTVCVGGIPVTAVSHRSLADAMVGRCRGGPAAGPALVFSCNGQAVSMAARDPLFREALLAADIIHADGMSVVAASALFAGRPLPERVATSDFFHTAARRAAEAGLRFFFLGGKEAVNRRAYEAARRLYPDVAWVGRRNGYFSPAEEAGVCAEIRAARPDVVWVGLGRPKQELFCVRHRGEFAGVGWLKTCGGLFDFLAGANPRAPAWVQRAGFEWLYRMAREPLRLGPRYAYTNLDAIWQFIRWGAHPYHTAACEERWGRGAEQR